MRHAALLVLAVVLACDSAPSHPDAALYRKAYDLTVAGKEAEARPLYHRIIDGDAYSPYQSGARLALAEMLFKEGQYDKALALYRSVEAYPRAATMPYALYKQGWCLLNKGQYVEAMQVFERVLALPAGTIPEDRRRSLMAAARRDLVKAYSRAGLPEKAADYFHTHGGEEAPVLLEDLAELYAARNQWDRVSATARELIAAHVESPRICAWQTLIVRAALATGEKTEQLAEIQRLGAVLARLEAARGLPAETIADCRDRLQATSKELALLWHKTAQATKDPELYQLVDPLYRQYLTRFGAGKDAYDMTFFHAEALWSLERWSDAYEEYRRVVELDPTGKHAREAAYGAVLAAKNALEAEEGRKLEAPASGPAGPPQPLSPGDRRLLAAFELYVSRVPDSPELAAIEYRRARLHYDRNRHAEAAPLFWRVVERHPESELAIYAGNLYLDSLNVLGRKAEVCSGARKLLGGPLAARDPEAQRQWRRLAADCTRLEARTKTPGR